MSECCSVKAPASPPVMSCPESGSRSKRVEAITVKSLVRRLPSQFLERRGAWPRRW